MRRFLIVGLLTLLALTALACAQPEPTPTPIPPPPVAYFSLDVSSENAPVTVQFTDTSQGAVTAWQWDFGDGASSTEQNPTHDYTMAGSFTVGLVASGPGGSHTAVAPGPVTIKPGPLVEVAVTPSAITLQVQETARLQAKAIDQFGNLISDAVPAWTLVGPGGTIDEAGLFTAGTQAGGYEGLVQVTATQEGKSREALIDVTITPGALYAVAIEPAEVALDIGASQRFTFRAVDEFGNHISDVLSSWSAPAEVGEIDANGVLTTGTKAGLSLGAIRIEVVKGTGRATAMSDLAVRPGALATVQVEPSFAVVDKRYIQKFKAIGLDQYGNVIPGLAFLWGATGGEITQAGLYTASESGSFPVTASATFRGSLRRGSAVADVPLVAWWPGEGNANDVARGHQGTLNNGATFTTGNVGQAFSFDGVDDSVRIINAQNIPTTGPFTAQAWIKYNSSEPAGVNPEVLTIGGFPFCPSGGIHAIILGGKTAVGIGRGCGAVPHFACHVRNAGIGDSTWHHVTTVWNGTHSFVYIDGILRAQCSGTDYTRATTRVSLGGRPDEDSFNSPFRGHIDGVSIYNRAFSGDEVKATYDVTPAPTPTPTPAPTPTPGVTPPELVKVANLPGGDIMEIAFAPSDPNVVYLLSDNNSVGAWRSDDTGETWRQILVDWEHGNCHTPSMAVHPTDPDVVLMADPCKGIIKTEDGGLYWKQVHPVRARFLPTAALTDEENPRVLAVAFSPSLPSVAYAVVGRGDTIFKSTDDGDTWQRVANTGAEFDWLVVDPGSSDTLYGANPGDGGGVWKITDGGQTWRKVLRVPTFVVDFGHSDLADVVFAAGAEGIFKSADGGASWRRTLDTPAHSVQVAPSDPRIVYAGTTEGVFKSVDGGGRWQRHSDGMEYPNVGPLTVHPMDPNTVLAASNINLWTRYGGPFPDSVRGEGIYKTTDGGLSWARKGHEVIDLDIVEVAVDPSNPDVVYAGTGCSRGIYRSEDGGASWTILSSGTGPGTAYSWNIAHYTMRIVTAADSVWLTGQDGMGWSPDGGQTWQQPFVEQRHFHGIAISPHDPKLIFVGTVANEPEGTTYYPGAHILRSTDGGDTWEDVETGFPSGADTAVEDFVFDPFNPKVVYVATSSHHRTLESATTLGVYKSTDGGETWMPVNTGLSNMNVHSIVASPATPGLLYAGTRGGVYRSTDGGDTWAPVGRFSLPLPVWSLLLDPAEPRSLYAGTGAGLFWSPDGGETWQRLDSVPVANVFSLAMDNGGNVLYAVVAAGIFGGIFKGVKS